IATCSAPDIPVSLWKQLKDGGRLVIPVGGSFGQDLILDTKEKGRHKKDILCGCVFVPLIGKYGWREND
ncbi:MAG TPA: protein-L-isoaspartate O-methyltransferase, partial [Candidatus Omnitrophica bacterium]|nr:protein-L-isoaspartate O-methyltransferase [Candidatus Omnitrophota bacterium]